MGFIRISTIILAGVIWLQPLLAQPESTKAPSPKKLIRKAIQAIGGAAAAKRAKGARRWHKVEFLPEKETFLGSSWSNSTDRLKIVLTPDKFNGASRILVMKGDSGWMEMDGLTMNLDADMLARFRRARHADLVSGLVGLLDKKGFIYESLGEVKVKKAPAFGVKVKYAGQPDIHLFFDKKSGLLIKTWQKFIDVATKQPVVHEFYYADYQIYDPVAADRRSLQALKQPADGPSLIDWLTKRTPSGKSKQKIAKLIKDLGADSFRKRARATAALKKMGVEAAPLLRAALDSNDAEVIDRVKNCLKHIENGAEVRRVSSVVRLIAVQRPKKAAKVLLNYLPWSPNEEIRRDVLAALIEIADRNGKPHPQLVKALTHRNPELRAAARAVLRKDKGEYARKPGRRLLIRGLKRSMKAEMYRNGQVHMRLQTLKVEYYNRLPERLFERATTGPKF